MNGEYIPGEDINPAKSEHLKEGFDPIMACVSPGNYFSDENLDTVVQSLGPIQDINWHYKEADLAKSKLRNAGEETYVISNVDASNKSSIKYLDCTGLVVVGRDSVTGQEISFLTHQKPVEFLKKHREEFIKDLGQSLDEVKRRSLEGSIDAVIFAGNSAPELEPATVDDYNNSLSFLTSEVLRHLGFPPVVLTKPKSGGGFDNVILDTKNRQLYVIKPADKK